MSNTADGENFTKTMVTTASGAATTPGPISKPKQENVIMVANCLPTDVKVDVQEMKV